MTLEKLTQITAIILLILFYIVVFSSLSGCTTHTTNIVTTNKLIQTDYDYDCLGDDKTFSQIIMCYQKQDASEKAQNHVTNTLLNEK